MNAARDGGHCPQEHLAIGWAMNALEPEEQQAAGRHLADCPICRETVRTTEELGALLGASVQQEDPPPALRDRVMALAERTPQVAVEPFPYRLDRTLSEQPPAPVSLDARRRPDRGRALLVAAAAVILVLGGIAGVLGIQIGRLTDQQQAQAKVLEVVTDPTMRRAVLNSTGGQPVLVLLSSQHGAAVVPANLQPNAGDTSYVVWGLSAGQPVALSRFDLTATGPETIDWSTAAAAHRSFAISVEPGKALPAKPSQVLASGQEQ